jgi:hypothetical protein
MMGFDKSQSTVSLLGYYAPNMYSGMGGVNASFVPANVISSVASAAGKNNISIATIPRNVAVLLQNGLGPNGQKTTSKTELITKVMGYTGGSKYLIWPIVVGDPESARVYTGGPGQYGTAPTKFYGMQAFQTRLITGATKTTAGKDPAAPGAPTYVQVYYKDGKAYLSWSAPAGGGTGLKYQVSYTGGGAGGMANPGGVLPDTGSPTPPSAPAAPLNFVRPPELASAFEIGAWPREPGTYDPTLDGKGILPGTLIFGLFNSSYTPIATPSKVTGYTKAASPAAMVPGSYYILTGASGFNYVLIRTASAVAAPLVYTPAPLDSAHSNFPSWIDVPAGAMSVIIPDVNPDDQYYNNFWVRAVNDKVGNAVKVAQSSSGIILDTSASGHGAWAKAAVTSATGTPPASAPTLPKGGG